MNECRSEITREAGYSREKRLYKRGVTREVYSECVIWIE